MLQVELMRKVITASVIAGRKAQSTKVAEE